MRQLLATWCPAELKESLAAAPEGMGSINVLAGDLEGKADWDLADLTRGPDIGIRTSIRGDYTIFLKRARWSACPFPRRWQTHCRC